MARKTVDYSPDKGRDKGKLYRITEMSAAKAESWAFRVLLAVMSTDMDVPENLTDLGMAGLARMGIQALPSLKYELAEPLLQEMMDCVGFVSDPRNPHFTRPLLEETEDIEELSTRLALRKEWIEIHMGFFQDAAPSIMAQSKRRAKGH